MITSRKKAYLAAKIAQDKKVKDLTILDMRKVCNFCNYFVVLTVRSNPQSQAVKDAVSEGFTQQGIAYRINGNNSDWVLIDSYDVVVHIFDENARDFYSLERLWQNASQLKLPSSVKNGPKKVRRKPR
ncbi:MAG: ribosome silencing factor [Candidatus Gygaella obscura]|nr:ribosome silencing factor [Candidatus Gygaella obscura]